MKEFISAIEEKMDEEEKRYVPFAIDGREYRSYVPNEAQLIFLMATLGRGQDSKGRFASMLNLLLETLREEDREVLEGRLLSRGRDRLDPKVIEGVFTHLLEEWFATPSDAPSDSADTEQTTSD